ncbi:hypothetical protein PVW51_20810 [Sulfitobacter sp. PR48]|jgi:hypothetical protein|uniref:Uncharacterized protein n=1 Tax=Sulfitobacter porphyrae TaxID=1246864 RepID=A0ABW2B3J4_9RHOB|nr:MULTISPECIES: hypothetical protein [unclassified Sulfitobacter]MCZ4258477.1 hypothetical protein [Sulfitobacter sp. G21635-S1]MDD9723153.1 hypothetical protein [Sulfitobacter sp. PR48]GLT09843.1 hypothetical protein GCM10007928_20750 [Sulfitobacter porphyrae]
MSKAKGTTEDPKALIHESYQIEGITLSECRSIFLDWALSLPLEEDTGAAIKTLLERYGDDAPDHPMSQVLREGQGGMTAPRRRGGWRGRTRN